MRLIKQSKTIHDEAQSNVTKNSGWVVVTCLANIYHSAQYQQDYISFPKILNTAVQTKRD